MLTGAVVLSGCDSNKDAYTQLYSGQALKGPSNNATANSANGTTANVIWSWNGSTKKFNLACANGYGSVTSAAQAALDNRDTSQLATYSQSSVNFDKLVLTLPGGADPIATSVPVTGEAEYKIPLDSDPAPTFTWTCVPLSTDGGWS